MITIMIIERKIIRLIFEDVTADWRLIEAVKLQK